MAGNLRNGNLPDEGAVHPISIPLDNYSYCIQNERSALVIDPGAAAPVIDFCARREIQVAAILLTHHHSDHKSGASKLAHHFSIPIVGPDDRRRGCTQTLSDNERTIFSGITIQAIATPGHTRSHLCYYAPEHRALFTGDTLFFAGCGRLFEGTAAEMRQSLMRLASFPDSTLVYCGHEYTEENLAFAYAVDPENSEVMQAMQQVKEKRTRGLPSVPSTIALEKLVNPFLRASDDGAFAALRKRKDRF